MTDIKKDPLKPFLQHGVVFKGANQSQAYGDCPFTGKEGKFYVNKRNQLWDSKVAGYSGNVLQFLERMNEQNQQEITKQQLDRLAENRGLPPTAIKKFGIGKSSKGYTFPVKDDKGKLVDLRIYRLGKKVMGTAGCPTHIFNVGAIRKTPATYPVYLCEGEWDGMAMDYLLKRNKIKAVAVAVPGANVFKREWATHFKGRDVVVCYDNDEAGEAGELIVKDRLQATANSLSYLHWTAKFPTGYDIRDLVSQKAVAGNKPVTTYKAIKKMLRKDPRKIYNNTEADAPVLSEDGEELNLNLTLQDVHNVVGKWLKLNDYDGFNVAMATVLSTALPGDPIWTFFVGAPGGAKTEQLQAFSKCRFTYFLSSLTPHSLVSGSSTTDGQDPSVLPKLDEKCLIIKDFTTIMGLREHDKDMIFSILRDAYDGKTSKAFGRGFTREYEIHFSMLAGVTPAIYEVISRYSGLGDRFLKFNTGGALEHFNEEEIMRKALQNVGHEKQMREEISAVTNAYVVSMMHKMKLKKFKLPELDAEMETRLIAATQYASCLRATVSRHMRDNDIIMSKPFREVGTRLVKQLKKIMCVLAFMFGHDKVGEDEYRIGKKILLDTVDQRTEEIARMIFLHCPTQDDTVTASEIQIYSKYNRMTVRRILDDLTVLKVTSRQGKANRYDYTITPKIRSYLETSELYVAREHQERVRATVGYERTRTPKKKIVIRRKKRRED